MHRVWKHGCMSSSWFGSEEVGVMAAKGLSVWNENCGCRGWCGEAARRAPLIDAAKWEVFIQKTAECWRRQRMKRRRLVVCPSEISSYSESRRCVCAELMYSSDSSLGLHFWMQALLSDNSFLSYSKPSWLHQSQLDDSFLCCSAQGQKVKCIWFKLPALSFMQLKVPQKKIERCHAVRTDK